MLQGDKIAIIMSKIQSSYPVVARKSKGLSLDYCFIVVGDTDAFSVGSTCIVEDLHVTSKKPSTSIVNTAAVWIADI